MQFAKQCAEERLVNLTQQENTTVLGYEYDSPLRDATPEQAVKLAKIAIDRRIALGKEVTDEEAAAILKEDKIIETFSNTHPQIFKMMCDINSGPQSFQILTQLARFKKSCNVNGLSEAESSARVSDFLMSKCSRKATEQEQAKIDKESVLHNRSGPHA